MNEKRMREENDARANRSYMNRWVERTEAENRTRKAQEDRRKQVVRDN